MCKICSTIIAKLLQKGLVSEGNVRMCLDEIDKDMEKLILNTNSIELDMIIRHDRKGGYDA